MPLTYAQTTQARDARYSLLLRLEGVGEYAGPWTFCSTIPDYAAADSKYKALFRTWPGTMSDRAEVLGGLIEAGELDIELVDIDDVITAILRYDRDPTTELLSNITKTQTTVSVASTSALTGGSSVIFVGNEALKVTQVNTSTSIDVVRGHLDTDAAKHTARDPVLLSIPYIRSRRMKFYAVNSDAASAAQETELGTYFLDEDELGEELGSYVLRGHSALKYTARVAVSKPELYSIWSTSGDPSLPQLNFERPVAFKSPTFEHWPDEPVFVKVGSEIVTMVFHHAHEAKASAVVKRRAQLNTKPNALQSGGTGARVYAADTAGPCSFRYSPGPGASTSRSSGTWIKSAHWIDILLCLITSSAVEDDGLELNNVDATWGNWSSLPPGIGIGCPAAKVNFQAFMDVKTRTAGYLFPQFFCGDEPAPFGELVTKHFLRPIGAHLTVRDGLVTIVLPRVPTQSETVTAVGNDQILLRKTGRRSYLPRLKARLEMSLLASTVIYKARGRDGAEVKLVVRDGDFAGLYGHRGLYSRDDNAIEIDVPGVRPDPSGALGFLEDVAMGRLFRFHRAPWRVDLDTDFSLWSLQPGDIIAISNAELPNAVTGTRGWTSVPMEIVERAVHVDAKTGPWMAFGSVGFGAGGLFGRIPPSGVIVDVAGNVATVKTNRHTQSDAQAGLPTTDAAAFAQSDVLQLQSHDGLSATSTTQTISSISGDALTLNGNFGGLLTPGLVLSYAGRASTISQQHDRFVFWADRTNNNVGATSQPPWRYGEP